MIIVPPHDFGLPAARLLGKLPKGCRLKWQRAGGKSPTLANLGVEVPGYKNSWRTCPDSGQAWRGKALGAAFIGLRPGEHAC